MPRHVDIDHSKHDGGAIEQKIGAALLHDALQDRTKRLLDLLTRFQHAALDQRLPRLHFLLERCFLLLESLDLLRTHIGREDRDLLLQRLGFPLQRFVLAP